jgi:hypothetical protein
MLGQHVSHYGDTGLPEPVKGFAAPLQGLASTEGFQGIAVRKLYPSRGRYIESVRARGVTWLSTALEDVAQIIGGRIRTAISPRGKPQAPAASDISKQKP